MPGPYTNRPVRQRRPALGIASATGENAPQIATIEAADAERIGTLPRPDRAAVAAHLRVALAEVLRAR